MPDSAELVQLGVQPISEAAPAGESARYEPEYEQLEAEIAKLTSMEGGDVNWGTVCSLATEILEKKSKDLLVAIYLAYALLEREGYAGFVNGVDLVRHVCGYHWENMFPALKRMRGREQAFAWLVERVESYCGRTTASPADGEALTRIDELLNELIPWLDERMTDVGGCGLAPLQRQLRAAGQQASFSAGEGEAEGAAEAEAGGGESAGAPPAAGGAQVAVPQQSNPLDTKPFKASRSEALRRLEEIAAFFEKAEPHSPMGPMLRRVLRWGEMDYLTLYGELLKNSREGQAYLADALGVTPQQ